MRAIIFYQSGEWLNGDHDARDLMAVHWDYWKPKTKNAMPIMLMWWRGLRGFWLLGGRDFCNFTGENRQNPLNYWQIWWSYEADFLIIWVDGLVWVGICFGVDDQSVERHDPCDKNPFANCVTYRPMDCLTYIN